MRLKMMTRMRANAVVEEYTCARVRNSQTRSSRFVSRCVCRLVRDSFLSERVRKLAFATKTHLCASKVRFVITWCGDKWRWACLCQSARCLLGYVPSPSVSLLLVRVPYIGGRRQGRAVTHGRECATHSRGDALRRIGHRQRSVTECFLTHGSCYTSKRRQKRSWTH